MIPSAKTIITSQPTPPDRVCSSAIWSALVEATPTTAPSSIGRTLPSTVPQYDIQNVEPASLSGGM